MDERKHREGLQNSDYKKAQSEENLDDFVEQLDTELKYKTQFRKSSSIVHNAELPYERAEKSKRNRDNNIVELSEDRIKLDLRTPFEWVLIFLIALFGFAFIIVFLEEKSTLTMFYVIGAGVFLSVLLYALTSNYYILDRKKGIIFLRINFLGLQYEKEHIRFSDIIAITTTASEYRNKYIRYWEYTTVLVDKTGKIYPMSDAKREESGFDFCVERAKKMAEESNADFIPGKYHMEVYVEKNDSGKIEVKHRSPGFLNRNAVAIVSAGILLLFYILQKLFPDIFQFYK